VRAVARLPPERRPAVLLAGDGPERAALAALAASRGVDLRLLGVVDRRALGALRAAADLVVQPSRALPDGRTEGTPVAVREALASGCDVLASGVGGLPDLAAQHRSLGLIRPDDPGALAAALAEKLAGLWIH
jgi:glycosyltransferase involved in cell wall biosynthesis